LISDPACWSTLDYNSVAGTNTEGAVDLKIDRDGVGHGLILWFDSELVPGISFSNAPGEPNLIYGRGFLPFESPVTLKAGDSIGLLISAHLVGDRYVWRWQTSVESTSHTEDGQLGFSQSSVDGSPVAADRMKRWSNEYRPGTNENLSADRRILAMIDGSNTLGDIAGALQSEFPALFPSWEDALTRAARVADRYDA
jgi:hypothetical protein